MLLWNKSRDEKVVYLTFDDGPIPDVTTFVLNTLNKYQVKATFFCIGDNIRKYPDIFSEIRNNGHAIGNHTFNHLKGWDTPDQRYVENFTACQELTQSHLFRPPYGRIKKSQIKRIFQQQARNQTSPPFQIVMWDVLSADYDLRITGEKCYKNVINHSENGSIIVFHDSIKAFPRMQYALPKAIEYFKENGYTFGVL